MASAPGQHQREADEHPGGQRLAEQHHAEDQRHRGVDVGDDRVRRRAAPRPVAAGGLPAVPLAQPARADLGALFVGAGIFAVFFFVTLWMQVVNGYSPVRSGLAFLPMTVLIGVAAGIGSQLLGRIGPWPLLLRRLGACRRSGRPERAARVLRRPRRGLGRRVPGQRRAAAGGRPGDVRPGPGQQAGRGRGAQGGGRREPPERVRARSGTGVVRSAAGVRRPS